MEILNLKERYPFECQCGRRVDVAPSIFMSGMQLNKGGVYCNECKTHTPVIIDRKNEKIIKMPGNDMMRLYPLPKACYREATPEEEKIIQQHHAANKSK
jgi:hypothetical protein